MGREEVKREKKPGGEAECIDETQVGLVVGVRGAGKSTTAHELLREHMKDGGCVVVWDPHDEFSENGRKSRQVRTGSVPNRAELSELLVKGPDELWAKALQLAVVPSTAQPKQCAAEFLAFAEAFTRAMEVRDERMPLLWVSELGILEDEAEAKAFITYWATQSRHIGEGFGLGMDGQAAVMVPPRARRQVTKAWFHALYHRLDLDAVDDIVGVTAPGLRDELAVLGQHEYRFWQAPMTKQERHEAKE